jgi:Zn-dependent protease
MIELLRHCFGPAIACAATDAPTWDVVLMLLLGTVIANTVHAYGHAWMADRLGDDTPRLTKRLTLNPFASIDPLGLLLMFATMLIGFPLGWSKPVRTNPENYRVGARLGTALVASAGPFANLLTAILFAPIARAMIAHFLERDGQVSQVFMIALFSVVVVMGINVANFVFNLTPVAPMDAAFVVASALPPSLGDTYRKFMARWGGYLLFGLMATNILPPILGNAITRLLLFLLGLRL